MLIDLLTLNLVTFSTRIETTGSNLRRHALYLRLMKSKKPNQKQKNKTKKQKQKE